MFRKTITTTPFVTQMANNCFKNVTGSPFNNDLTFVSTLRALLCHRVKEGERVHLEFIESTLSKSTIEENDNAIVLRDLYDSRDYSDGTIIIHNLARTSQDNLAAIRVIEDVFISENDGFERIEKITDFFKKTFYSICFVNKSSRKVVIFVDKLNVRRMHYLQCAIFAFLPWYFDPKEGVTEDEMELIQSLRETGADRYMEAISKIACECDLRGMYIREQLKDFETTYERMECSRVEDSISEYISKIKHLNDRISTALISKRNEEIKLLGLKDKIARAEEDSEIMEYFLCNSKLDLMRADGNELEFIVRDYLLYFDEDMAKSVIDNDRSYIYRGSEEFNTEDVKKLMYAIFIDQVFKIRFCCAYSVRLGERVKGLRGYYYSDMYDTYMPNPHIDAYSCLGNYERTMNERLLENDTIGVIEQCVASCKSLNFGDSTVMEKFITRMTHKGYNNNKCIELPDGSIVDMWDAIKWMKEQEESSRQPEESEEEAHDVEGETSENE